MGVSLNGKPGGGGGGRGISSIGFWQLEKNIMQNKNLKMIFTGAY